MLTRIARRLSDAQYQRKRRTFFRRSFDPHASRRLLLLAVNHRIPQSQLFPFHYYADAFRTDLDVDIREIPVDEYLNAKHLNGATTVCFQTHFDISDDALLHLVAELRRRNPGARLVYLDWFAPTDLRLAERIGPLVDAYVSKHLLRDMGQYGQPTFGDTTLMDYYGRVHNLMHDMKTFPVSTEFKEKLYLGPSFVTADFMLPVFDRGIAPSGPRPIELHARIAVEGTPWYRAMRQGCADAVAGLRDVECVTGFGIRHDLFLRELRRSKICFSPFGYGEVCWRDYEAIMCGAVLLKQDTSHVATAPDIFEAFETYVPVKWDLSDLPQQVAWLLRDKAARTRIAGAAFDRLHSYARTRAFVGQMAPALFPDAP
ncbi:glycosyltransferase [Roseovarius dicentrarchi]|uniref:glycosyltransferase n=1 Tax=Roseovarius dicentrarchi TaxID=2250573 RepID=UPI000DE947D0|nr:glycosyltransferase [Roseovarius dicentrarchi]